MNDNIILKFKILTMVFTGKNVFYGVGIEGTRGAGTSQNIKIFIDRTDSDFQDKQEEIQASSGVGTLMDSSGSYIVKQSSNGKISGNLKINTIPFFLHNLFGTSISTNKGSGFYEHLLTLNNSNTHDSLVIYKQYDELDFLLYNLVMVKSLTITCNKGEFAKLEVELEGKSGKKTSKITANYGTQDYEFLTRFAHISIADQLTEDTVDSNLCLNSFTIKFETELEDIDCMNSIEKVNSINKKLMISGNLELTYKDNVFKELVKNKTYKMMRVKFLHDEVFAGSKRAYLQFDLFKVGFSDLTIQEGIEDIVTQNVSFKAYQNTQTNKAVECKIGNTFNFKN